MSAEEQAELQAAAPQAKRPRKSLPTSSAGGVFSFHHEDELTQQVRRAIDLIIET